MIILLQNGADITKRAKGYYKTGQVLQNGQILQNGGKGYYKTGQVLQNGAGITKRGRYYKTGQGLLQNGAGITKRGNYYETRQYTGGHWAVAPTGNCGKIYLTKWEIFSQNHLRNHQSRPNSLTEIWELFRDTDGQTKVQTSNL